MLRDFFLGFIRIHILHHAAQEPLYGLSLIDELRRHGYTLSPGTLYPVLHRLEADGYLARTDRVVAGKVRRYYAITRSGRRALHEARRQILELVREVMEEQAPARGPARRPSWRRAADLRGRRRRVASSV